MKIKTQDYGTVTVVELQGELDGDFVEMFQNSINNIVASHKSGIVLDMNGVGFIDSQGLSQLLWTRDYCHQNNCQLKLVGLDVNCLKILEITRLVSEFDHYAELDVAVKSFA